MSSNFESGSEMASAESGRSCEGESWNLPFFIEMIAEDIRIHYVR